MANHDCGVMSKQEALRICGNARGGILSPQLQLKSACCLMSVVPSSLHRSRIATVLSLTRRRSAWGRRYCKRRVWSVFQQPLQSCSPDIGLRSDPYGLQGLRSSPRCLGTRFGRADTRGGPDNQVIRSGPHSRTPSPLGRHPAKLFLAHSNQQW